jgi:hypothetical protein
MHRRPAIGAIKAKRAFKPGFRLRSFAGPHQNVAPRRKAFGVAGINLEACSVCLRARSNLPLAICTSASRR